MMFHSFFHASEGFIYVVVADNEDEAWSKVKKDCDLEGVRRERDEFVHWSRPLIRVLRFKTEG